MEHERIINQWMDFEIPEVFEREGNIDFKIDFIWAISGPRRSGKTYFCFKTIKELERKGFKKNILYINFEDPKLLGANENDLDKLLESFYEFSDLNKGDKLFLFLDEIQNVRNWDIWVRHVYDTLKNIKIVLTGSSSKLLSKEISTKLRGRVVNKEIFPVSFRELLLWKNIEYNLKTVSYKPIKTKIKKLFNFYLRNGGYPALIFSTVNNQEILKNYFDSMILKDIVERHNIQDVKKLNNLANLLFESVTKEISYNKITNKLKSLGFKLSKNTVIEHLSYFEDAYLFFQNLKYDYSLTKQLGSIKKIYCMDNGMLDVVSFKFSKDDGKLLENLCFVELRRAGKEIFYFRENRECDFVIKEKNKISSAIQVCYKLNEENKKREIDGLLEAMDKFNLKKGIILTDDQKDNIKINNKEISIQPAWEWMLKVK